MPSSNNHDHNVTEITATVMVQTEAALKRMMESTQLTIGEVIDRLALQMTPRDKETAAVLASERVAMCFSQLPKAQSMAAYLEFLTCLHPSSHPRSWMSCARVPNSIASSLCKSLKADYPHNRIIRFPCFSASAANLAAPPQL